MLDAVIQHVVAHLMRHHRADFRWCGAIEQIIVQRNTGCAEETADVGADPLGLLGGIEVIDVFGGNAVGAGHGKDFVADGAFGKWSISVEKRRDEHWPDHDEQHDEDRASNRAQRPPRVGNATQNRVEHGECDPGEHHIHAQADTGFTEPGHEGEIG